MHDGPNSKPSNRDWLILAALLALAILIRLPRVGAMESAYDYLTSHTALTVRIWQTAGLAASHYSLIMNWPNPADRHIADPVMPLTDAAGNFYYCSFPPFGFYLAYGFFALTGQGTPLMDLRVLMWLFSTAGALALWRVCRRAGLAHASTAAAVFLLAPTGLYFYGLAFYGTVLSIPMWMILVLVALDEEHPRPWLVALLAFLLCYTDWAGYPAVVPLALVWLWRRNWRMAAALCAGPVLAAALMSATYASVAGWEPFLVALRARFSERSGQTTGAMYAIARNYYLGYAPVVLLFAVAALPWSKPRLTRQTRTLLFCFMLPVVLDHLLLMNHTANHRYAVLKTAPAIGVALAILLNARRRRNLYLDVAAGTAALAWSVAMYYQRPIGTDPGLAALAKVVQYQAGTDRVLFLETHPGGARTAEPPLVLLTERNFHPVADMAQARQKLKDLGVAKGLYVGLTHSRPASATAIPIEASPDPVR